MAQNSKNDFEKKLKNLEEIIKLLENESTPLEQSLLEFEKGVKLFKECKKTLHEAEIKIKVLTDNLEEVDY